MFDFEHTAARTMGMNCIVQQMTPMPSLRLTIEEARDIASYLMTRKNSRRGLPGGGLSWRIRS